MKVQFNNKLQLFLLIYNNIRYTILVGFLQRTIADLRLSTLDIHLGKLIGTIRITRKTRR